MLASQPLPGLIARTCIWAAMIGGAAFFARHRFHEPLPIVMAAASAGFAAAFILQGKGFPYHGYPMVALAALVLSLAVAGARFASSRHPPGLVLVAATALIACPAVWLNSRKDYSAATAALQEVAHRPTVLAIAGDVAVGHPLVRNVGGRWVGRVPWQWMTFGALTRIGNDPASSALRERLAPFQARDREILVEDIRREKPRVILIERAEDDWARGRFPIRTSPRP